MLRPKSHPDRACRDSPQNRPSSELFQSPWKRHPLIGTKHASDESILYENLHALRDAGWKLAPGLHFTQRVDTDRSFAQSRGEDIRGRDRILNREVDTHPANRRHRVRGIADAQEPGAKPCPETINGDRQ